MDGKANGDGIGVWIKTELPMKHLLDQQDDSLEILWLSVGAITTTSLLELYTNRNLQLRMS